MMIDTPKWIFVEKELPTPMAEVKITDGVNIYRGYLTNRNTWTTLGIGYCKPIAWLFAPPMETPEPPTIEEHEEWLELTGRKVTP